MVVVVVAAAAPTSAGSVAPLRAARMFDDPAALLFPPGAGTMSRVVLSLFVVAFFWRIIAR